MLHQSSILSLYLPFSLSPFLPFSLSPFLPFSLSPFLLLPNNSFASFCGFVVLIALYNVLMFVIVYLFFSPCGYLSYIRTINMKAVTFSIQAIDD